MLIEIILFFVFLFMLFYYYITKNFGYFDGQDIPVCKPSFPFGSAPVKKMFMGEINFLDVGKYVAEEYPDAPVIGYFMFRQPRYLINDPELAKLVQIKDFDYFAELPSVKTTSEYINNNLTLLPANEWKKVRSLLSTVFTSARLKVMLPHIVQVGNNLEGFLMEKCKKNEEIDTASMVNDFSLDVIATNGFGIEINSFKDPDNMFRKMALRYAGAEGFRADSPMTTMFKFLLVSACPYLANDVLKLDIMPRDAENFLVDIVKRTYQHRVATGEKRNDLIGLIVEELKEGGGGKKPVETAAEDEFEANARMNMDNCEGLEEARQELILVSNVLILFTAALSTTTLGITAVLHRMAVNQEVQEKVYEEIMEIFGDDDWERADAKTTFERLQDLKYSERVIHECFRYTNNLQGHERRCTKNYQVPGTSIVIPKDTNVVVFVGQMMEDEKNWVNPKEFDPDNFAPENLKNKFAYQSFSQGPRNCIGMRYAVFMMKIALVAVLRKFRILRGVGLKEELKLALDLSGYEGGVPIKVELRQ